MKKTLLLIISFLLALSLFSQNEFAEEGIIWNYEC